MNHILVIPAKAGISLTPVRHDVDSWTPAFAGVAAMGEKRV